MVESEFSFFQVQVKRMFSDAVKLFQATLCVAPERFNAVDMPVSIRKLILAVMHPEVLVKTNFDQSIIAAPAIRMKRRAGLHMPPENGLQRVFRTVRHDFGIDLALTLQQPKHDGLGISSATLPATHAMHTEIRLIDFYRALQRLIQLTGLSNSTANLEINIVGRSNRKSSQFSRAHRGEIQSNTTNQLPEFSLADFRTSVISIFTNHLKKLSHI